MLSLLAKRNDVTTDLDDPPAFTEARVGPMSEANRRSTRRYHADLTTLRLPAPPAEVFARAQAAAEGESSWTLSRVDADAGHIEGVARTQILGFCDDFVIRVRADGDGSAVDMRSRSRVGRNDLGANARRIRGFFGALAG
jgi:hypothetical protein